MLACRALRAPQGVSSSAIASIELLTGIAKWRLCAPPLPALEKTFAFRDKATAARFRVQAADLQSRARRPFSLAPDASDTSVIVRIPPASAAMSGGELGDEEVAVANAVDDIGAHLQLAGKWG